LISTKKEKGKISVDVNSSVSFDKVNVEFKLQDKFGQGTNGVWTRNNANSYGDKFLQEREDQMSNTSVTIH
jgi:hypothetical protein